MLTNTMRAVTVSMLILQLSSIGCGRPAGPLFTPSEPEKTPGGAGAPESVWPPLCDLILSRGGVTDIREIVVSPHKDANASERLFLNKR